MAKRFINDLVVNGGLDAAGLTGTVPSGVLPEATSSQLGAVTKHLLYHVRTGDVAIPSGSLVTLTNLVALNNPGGAWNLTTGVFTVPSDGVYFISAQVNIEPWTASAGNLRITQNDVTVPGLVEQQASSSSAGTAFTLNGFGILTAGAAVTFKVAIREGTGNILSGSASPDYSRLQIIKVNAAVS